MIDLKPGDTFTLNLPAVTDPDNDLYSMKFAFGSTQSFCALSEDLKSIIFQPTQKDIKSHKIQIILADNNKAGAKTSTYNIIV